jgi:NADPH:quinone reductase-like Zn-dependent oxidoreductase
MKAVVYAHYGSPDNLRLADVQTPVPKGNEVLVKVRAVSLNRSDWEGLQGKPLYSRIGGPLGRGARYSGRTLPDAEATGPGATLFAPGDDVFADILRSHGRVC